MPSYGFACINKIDHRLTAPVFPIEETAVPGASPSDARERPSKGFPHWWSPSGWLNRLKHDGGSVDTYIPRALGHRLIGADDAGVEELDVNGRSLNRPVPLQEGSPNQGV
jgi:hypothetical protein